MEKTDTNVCLGGEYLNLSTAQERYTMISIAKQMPLELDTHWFVVSLKWFRAWEVAVLAKPSKEFPHVTEETLGPVDNSDILLPGTSEMQPDLVEGYDIEFVPEDAWENLVKWYGQPPIALKREVIAYPTASGMPETRIEVYQPTFHAFMLTHNEAPILNTTFKISSRTPISTLAARAASSLQVPNTGVFRVWNMPPKTPKSGITVGSVERHALLPIPLDSDAPLTELNRLSRVLAVEVRSGGCWLLDSKSVSIPTDPSTSVKFQDANTVLDVKLPFEGRPARTPVPRGTMGLQNLGNTCFMNAGLQCLLHIPELEHYFLNDLHRHELNPDNPLGMQGQLANAFSILMRHMYPTAAKPSSNVVAPNTSVGERASGANHYSSYVPLDFKGVLCRWAPKFAGYEECDSQELIGIVLDGLHEDLNRILKKPYVEKPEWPEDSQGTSNSEIEARIAQETWKGHARRNDSIIADLFQGMYKSTLTCPDCGKASVTFDPFMSLSLPLPATRSAWKHTVYFVPWDMRKQMVTVNIELPKDSTANRLKIALSDKLDVKQENLMVTEVWKHKFFKFFEDETDITDVTSDAMLVVYELPVRAVPIRANVNATFDFQPFQPEYPLIIPVLHMSSNSTFGLPFLVVVNSSSSESYEGLKVLVAERYKQWVQPNGVPNEDFELRIFNSNGNTMETGFRLGFPGTSFVDWAIREHDLKGKPLVNPTEALVCIWHPNSQEQLFPRNQSTFDRWVCVASEKGDELDLHDSYTHPENQEITLADCLEELTKTEQLGISDVWYCPRCQQHCQATKQIQLWSLPNILILQLKRFAKRSKIDKLVSFPIHGLDLSAWVGERASADNCIYDLFAVDEHWGDRMSTGHYSAYAKNQSDGAWYHYQDSVVSPVAPRTAINRGAYLLFYRRRSASVKDVLSKVGNRVA